MTEDQRRHRQTLIVAIVAALIGAGATVFASAVPTLFSSDGAPPAEPASSSAGESSVNAVAPPATVGANTQVMHLPEWILAPNDEAKPGNAAAKPDDRSQATALASPSTPAASTPASEPCKPYLIEAPKVETVRMPDSLRQLSPGPSCIWGALGERLTVTINLCSGRRADFRAVRPSVYDRTVNDRKSNHAVEMLVERAGENRTFTDPILLNSKSTISIPSGSAFLRLTIDGGDRYGELAMGICRLAYN